MTANSPFSGIARGLVLALSPLKQAMTSLDGFILLISALGWRPDLDEAVELLFDGGGGTAPDDTFAQFRDTALAIVEAIDAAEDVASDLLAGQNVSAQEVLELIAAFRTVVAQIGEIDLSAPNPPALPAGLDVEPLWVSLRDELPDYLLARYLSIHQPRLYEVLVVLGLVDEALVRPGTDEPFRVAYVRYSFNWAYLEDLVTDPLVHLQELYRWNGAAKPGDTGQGLDTARLTATLRRLLRASGLRARIEPLAEPSALRFIADPAPAPLARPPQITLPLLEFAESGAFTRLGLEIAPVPASFGGPVDSLLLTHVTQGGVAHDLEIAENLRLEVSGSVDASRQINLVVGPGGPELIADAAVPYALEVGLTAVPDAPWLLFGAEGGTRITVAGFGAGVSLSGEAGASAEIVLNAQVSGLTVALAPGEGDGFFNALLEALALEASFDLALGWSSVSGLMVAGSGGLSAVIPTDLTLGPLTISDLEVGVAPVPGGLSAEALFSGSATLGPLFFGFDRTGLALSFTVAEDGDGMIGPLDLSVGFRPPTGYALALQADPVSGGGLVSVGDNEYRGALALSFEKIGFSAFGILATELPDGEQGYSFAATVFAEFSVPLAYGFFLTGLGGAIGVNRSIDTDAMREVLYDGRLDNFLFPADPIGQADTILDDMAAILPAQAGQFVIGPVARISWGQPQLIDITLGVMLELGEELRVVILGGLGMILPEEDKVLVALNIQFMGEIDFGAGTISFDATLEGSRVLTFAIDGDVAIRTGWTPGIEHIASFGGLHPQYPKPDNLPDLARLSIRFGGNNPRLTLSSYFTTTMNSLQVGARADMYAQGPDIRFVGLVSAEGFIAFDALIYFNPFAFQTSLRGGLSLMVDGDVIAALYFALSLSGPNTYKIDGEVWIKVWGVKVRFAITHTWGRREDVQTFVANAADLLAEALARAAGFEAVPASGRTGGAAFRGGEDAAGTLDPLGRLRFVQTTAPLGIALQRVGEADLAGPATLGLEVSHGGATLPVSAVDGDFVRGHFFRQSEAERLRSPTLERYQAGVEIGTDALESGGPELVSEYEYEVIEIPMDASDTRLSQGRAAVDPARFRRFTDAAMVPRYGTRAGLTATVVRDDAPAVAAASFVAPPAPGAANAPAVGTMTEIQGGLRGQAAEAGPVAAYLELA